VTATADPDGVLIRGTVTITSPGRLDRVRVPLNERATVFLEHGFQSWSTVRRTSPSDIRPERSAAPRWFRRQMLLDGDGAGRELSGDTFLVFDGGVIGALSNASQFTRIVVAGDGSLALEWFFDHRVVAEGDQISLEPHLVIVGDPGAAYDRYAQRSAAASGARTHQPARPAWCSWYQYFGRITPQIVRDNLRLAAAHGIDVVQIDDGWQAEIGVWTATNTEWMEPLDRIAQDITKAGCTPGIWTAPFLAIDGGSVAATHPEWLVRNDEGKPTTALVHGGWGGKVFALDTTHPDVIAHLEDTYRSLRAQGFQYFKIDFLHAAAAVGRRHRSDVTRAEAYGLGLAAIRRAIGDDSFLVGCGAPLLASVGFVDAMRVSEDVAPFFQPRTFFPGFPENTVAGRNALEPSLLRAPLHHRWFTLDPDCLLLRRRETELTEAERSAIAWGAAAVSDFLVLSDDLSLYEADDWDLAQQLWREVVRGPRWLVDPLAQPVHIRAGDTTWICDPWVTPPLFEASHASE
jgi:alpha-galactosidase